MKTKKTLALVLALLLVLALFAGCNNGGGTTTPCSWERSAQDGQVADSSPPGSHGVFHPHLWLAFSRL